MPSQWLPICNGKKMNNQITLVVPVSECIINKIHMHVLLATHTNIAEPLMPCESKLNSIKLQGIQDQERKSSDKI